VVRWRIRELLAERNITLYQFAKALGYKSVSSVYRRFPENAEFTGDVNAKLLDRVCKELGVGIGDILEYVPDSSAPKHRKR
jgi:DNA-binding Xre family transcriptional regulator